MLDGKLKEDILHIQPMTSRYLALWILAVHLGAICVLWPLEFPWMVKFTLSLLVLLHLFLDVRMHLQRKSGKSIRSLTIEGDDRWVLVFRDGRKAVATLSPHSFVSHWLMVLSFGGIAGTGGARLVLFPDSLDQERTRRLRIRLQRSQGMTQKGE